MYVIKRHFVSLVNPTPRAPPVFTLLILSPYLEFILLFLLCIASDKKKKILSSSLLSIFENWESLSSTQVPRGEFRNWRTRHSSFKRRTGGLFTKPGMARILKSQQVRQKTLLIPHSQLWCYAPRLAHKRGWFDSIVNAQGGNHLPSKRFLLPILLWKCWHVYTKFAWKGSKLQNHSLKYGKISSKPHLLFAVATSWLLLQVWPLFCWHWPFI